MSFSDPFLHGTTLPNPTRCVRGAAVHRSELARNGPWDHYLMLSWLSLKRADDFTVKQCCKAVCSAFQVCVQTIDFLCARTKRERTACLSVFTLVCQPPSALTLNGTASGCAMKQRGPATSRLEWRWRHDIDSLCGDEASSFYFFFHGWKLSQTWREWLQQ